MKTVLRILALFAAVWLWPSAASAQSCSVAISNVNFGDIAAAQVDTTATVTATCTSGVNLLSPIRVCVNIGGGSGGEGTGGQRFLSNGTNTLPFNLRSSSQTGPIWGSSIWPHTPRPPTMSIIVPLLGGTGSASQTLYARIPANSVPSGFYSSSFAGHIWAAYASDFLIAGNCNSSSGLTAVASQPSFTVTARKQVTCSVSATELSFGTVGNLNTLINGSATLSVTCSPNLPYQISLGNGQNGSSATTRRMRNGTNYVNYDLFSNSGRTTVWGDQPGDIPAARTGNGSAQSITVYGRVPAQTTPPAGTYNDTVVVTITY